MTILFFDPAKLVGAVCTANSQCVSYGQCGNAGTGSCQCRTSYSPSSDKKMCNGELPSRHGQLSLTDTVVVLGQTRRTLCIDSCVHLNILHQPFLQQLHFTAVYGYTASAFVQQLHLTAVYGYNVAVVQQLYRQLGTVKHFLSLVIQRLR